MKKTVMTVRELRDALAQLPEDLAVMVCDRQDLAYPITGVSIVPITDYNCFSTKRTHRHAVQIKFGPWSKK